jgi:hypothetical protein
VDIPTRTIINEQKVTIGTFRPEHLQAMYQFSPTPNFSHNVEFLEGFKQKECKQYDRNLSDLIKDWVSHPANFRVDGNGVYSISYLEPQFKYIAIHTVVEGCSFDWAKLLSNSLTSRIIEYRMQRTNGKAASFFMSAYIMDVVCFMTPFPLMSWS